MNEERLRVLKMLQEEKITADEAAELLKSLGDDGPRASGAARPSGVKGRAVRILVVDGEDTKVQVNIPIALIRQIGRLALKVIPEKVGDTDLTELRNLDWEELMRQIEEGVEGTLVEVNDGDTRVEVSVA